MKIIYSGGYNKHSQKSIENSIIFTYYPYIKHFVKNGKKVAFVTLAKPDGYYNSLLLPKYEGVAEIIDTIKDIFPKYEYTSILFLVV